MVKTTYLSLATRGNTDVQDITALVARAVEESGLENGVVVVFTPSSTSALTTIEYESGCVSDLRRLFEEWIPSTKDYAHNNRWGDYNGHSHLRAAMLGPSITIPFVERRLCLGTWQQIIFIDFDVRPRQRRLVVQVLGT
jgi:secondary thiamine-phosphate synthase enzyme